MTIDEAKRVLSEMRNGMEISDNPQEFDAIKLGIEALAKLKLLRETGVIPEYIRLAGETGTIYLTQPPIERGNG